MAPEHIRVEKSLANEKGLNNLFSLDITREKFIREAENFVKKDKNKRHKLNDLMSLYAPDQIKFSFYDESALKVPFSSPA